MRAGIEIKNNHGTVLLDETYKNFAYVEGGTLTPALYAIQRTTLGGNATRSFRFQPPPALGPGAALQLFNAAQECTFDSRHKYARVVDEFAGPVSDISTITKTYPSGRSYAVIHARRGWFVEQEVRPTGEYGGPNGNTPYYEYRRRFWEAMCTTNGNQVVAGWAPLNDWIDQWTGPVMFIPQPKEGDRNCRFIVLDVTGY